ncbi:MAG: zf-HC2 domain-containing protein, partial [Acidobacteriota bacterium]|nr:zf-HC2 domain-containing protein [Acidobacteriota bacterium]
MNEKTNPAGSPAATPGCGRAADLVAYLYGEAGPAEARDFRLHLNACAACRDELAAFGDVRERGGEWRAWTMAVRTALLGCQAPLAELHQAHVRCWQDLLDQAT